MKKLVLSATLLLSLATFAQKEELKVLKKIYAKDKPSSDDIQLYKNTLTTLESKSVEESDKVYSNFYKGMLLLIEMQSLNENASPIEKMKVINPERLEAFSNAVTTTLDYEKKVGKKIYTDDINETLSWLKPMLLESAYKLNEVSKFKESANMFYFIYKLDKTDGSSLENAAILALQSQDYVLAQKYYEEFKNSDYLNNGVIYYAINKASKQEEQAPNLETRKNMIALGTHEKPRDEKMSAKKPEVYKTLATILAENKDFDKAKQVYKEAKVFAPKNVELLINEATLYYQTNDLVTYESLIKEVVKLDPNNASLHFNIGYLALAEDSKLVDQINASVKDVKKYNELTAKRKELFLNALPHFEKAYSIDPKDENTKSILKMTYEIVGQPEKAKAIN